MKREAIREYQPPTYPRRQDVDDATVRLAASCDGDDSTDEEEELDGREREPRRGHEREPLRAQAHDLLDLLHAGGGL